MSVRLSAGKRQHGSVVGESDVVLLQRLLTERRLEWCIVGGWGVDAILGVETRPHKDLDVLVRVDHLTRIRDLMASLGYRPTRLWEENRWLVGEAEGPDFLRATAFVLTDSAGREVDAHVFDANEGHILPLWQTDRRVTEEDLEWKGRIGNENVVCMSPQAQIRCHLGYNLPNTHRADVEQLEGYMRRRLTGDSRQ
jgi:lincosamide nucleotidyltransferase A/C/D/E